MNKRYRQISVVVPVDGKTTTEDCFKRIEAVFPDACEVYNQFFVLEERTEVKREYESSASGRTFEKDWEKEYTQGNTNEEKWVFKWKGVLYSCSMDVFYKAKEEIKDETPEWNHEMVNERLVMSKRAKKVSPCPK